jgi:hypothetical protein
VYPVVSVFKKKKNKKESMTGKGWVPPLLYPNYGCKLLGVK